MGAETSSPSAWSTRWGFPPSVCEVGAYFAEDEVGANFVRSVGRTKGRGEETPTLTSTLPPFDPFTFTDIGYLIYFH